MILAHPDLAEGLRARFSALGALEVAVAGGAGGAKAGGVHLRKVPLERYRDFKRVGQGGMGIVYWALDTELNRSVAFKVVRPDVGSEEGPATTPAMPLALHPPGADTPASQAFATLKARFLQEAWLTGGMEHPGIVPVYEVGETPEGVPYYTMRFVKGERTLAQPRATVLDTKGPRGPVHALEAGADVTGGRYYLSGHEAAMAPAARCRGRRVW